MIINYVTYENHKKPHLTIHHFFCKELFKHGGEQKYNQGGYNYFQDYKAAEEYAKSIGFIPNECKTCKPKIPSKKNILMDINTYYDLLNSNSIVLFNLPDIFKECLESGGAIQVVDSSENPKFRLLFNLKKEIETKELPAPYTHQ